MGADANHQQQLAQQVEEYGLWFHSLRLAPGLITPGVKPLEQLEEELASLGLGSLDGKSVLDIGAWDGFFSYGAERLGAQRVVALDHYVWSVDLPAYDRYTAKCRQDGTIPLGWDKVPDLWQPETLPGKQGFDLAHDALESKVESVVADFMDADLDALGSFDVVLYLGVLYHMRHPLLALERLLEVTKGQALIETEAILFPSQPDLCVCEFYPTTELNGDSTNWWAPTLPALLGLCKAAGFRSVEVLRGPPTSSVGSQLRHRVQSATGRSSPVHYRALVQVAS